MAFFNMYRNVSLPLVVESQSSCTFLAMDLVVEPELGLELGMSLAFFSHALLLEEDLSLNHMLLPFHLH